MDFRVALDKDSPYVGKLEGREFCVPVADVATRFTIREVLMPKSYRKRRKGIVLGKCHVILDAWQRSKDGRWVIHISRCDYAFRDGNPVQLFAGGFVPIWNRGEVDGIYWERKGNNRMPPSALVENIHDLLSNADRVRLAAWLSKLG